MSNGIQFPSLLYPSNRPEPLLNRIDPTAPMDVSPTRIPPATSSFCCGLSVPIPTFPVPFGLITTCPFRLVVMLLDGVNDNIPSICPPRFVMIVLSNAASLMYRSSNAALAIPTICPNSSRLILWITSPPVNANEVCAEVSAC